MKYSIASSSGVFFPVIGKVHNVMEIINGNDVVSSVRWHALLPHLSSSSDLEVYSDGPNNRVVTREQISRGNACCQPPTMVLLMH